MEVQTKHLPDESLASRFDDFFENLLRDDINKLLSSYPQTKSLEVDFHLLERFDHHLADNVLLYPDEYISAAENALASRREATALGDEFKPYVRFYNLPATSQVEVLNLGAEHLDKFITLEGVASSISEIKPRMTIAVWQCNACQRKYHLPVGKVEPLQPPQFCSAPDCGGASKFTLLEKGSNFTDMQSLGMQDPVEKMHGNMPTVHAELWLEEDLTNTVAPGDKVLVTGVLRLKPINEGKVKKSIYQKFVDVNSIRKIEIDFEELKITKEEEKQLAELARDPKLFDKIVASVAPSVFGYNELKQAIALQLFGGTHGKVLPDGEVIRSDTHILMIGDPGCLVAGERVFLGNGAVARIDSMGSTHLQALNQQVLTGQGHSRAIATCFHTYKNQPILEIVTESGKSIKGTYNHPLRAVEGMTSKWKRLDEIRAGDRLATVTGVECSITAHVKTGWTHMLRHYGPRAKSRLPKELDAELAGLLGYVAGDGWVTATRVAMNVNPAERDLIPKLSSIISNQFGLVPKLAERRAEGKQPIFILEFHDVDSAACLSFLRVKRVPDLVFRSGNKVAASYLSWLFEADGCVFSKGRGKRAVQLKSSDIEFLRDVQNLLLRFSIHSRINERNLTIRRAESIRKFANAIGFQSAKKKTRMEKLVADCSNLHHERGGQRSERVVSVRPAGVADVYDIEVPKGHRFIANGIISHNTAKSTMLEYVARLAPKCIIVSGGGASGVGLTASAEKNEISGGWVLKAGAMVLANGGLVGIDEMDKMKEEDRAAIHQAMEQQKISVAKAGIVTEFQSKTAVLAAANPKQGRFDPNTPIASQFALSPTLLSRFDLIFAMKDTLDEKRDRGLAEHILEGHRYAGTRDKGESPIVPVIEADLLRKYIAYARRTVAPELTREASDKIRDYYVELRRQGKEQNTFTVTARQIEGLIRISEAHAKMRLSRYVEFQDAQKSIDLADFVLHEIYFDRETGRIDSDIVNLGQAKSKLDKIRNVLGIIGNLEKEVDLVAIDDVVREASSFGLDEAYTRRLIDELKRQGDLYEPKPGHIKQARAREW
ncbi:hypothetical protein AUJ14_01190 [Candidatus Micrarchaeota archaeon CG1_02_55_22]|nr:MAG: hypothetical protein AUJ14_01190 [Candidatus Micrarchaeota archaeon CG1_02_55_22]